MVEKQEMRRQVAQLLKIVNADRMILSDRHRFSQPDTVNLHWWSLGQKNGRENLGDYLAVPIYNFMTDLYGLDRKIKLNRTRHLYTVGSIINMGFQNAVIWGSGLIREENYKWRYFRKLDIRAVRGPETRRVLTHLGYNCPAVYGDPAVLMPLIYEASPNREKCYDFSVILHHALGKIKGEDLKGGNLISMSTTDYKYVIDEIVKSKCVISGSLHGIILAEVYGVPAVLLRDRENFELFKYKDYYGSTGRAVFPIADSLSEALSADVPSVPDFTEMRQKLLECFPVDLWE